MKVQTRSDSTFSSFSGLLTKGHYFNVPLDYEQPGAGGIVIYARELVAPENMGKVDLPWLIYLQGGPGCESPRPVTADNWIKRALQEYRVLLVDQRGTGLSSPITHETLTLIPGSEAQAEYLKHFRAVNIVRDCELMRKSLTNGAPWTVLGQSFGGWCTTTYLSIAPSGLAAAIFLGGLPPLLANPDKVYRATYKRVIDKNKLFYERFPEDVQRVRQIVDCLSKNPAILPSGEQLTARRFLQLGLHMGFNTYGFGIPRNAIHYLIEKAFVPEFSHPVFSYSFKRAVDNCLLCFQTNPLYAVLHEAIYCQKQASQWSAERILAEYPEFDLNNTPVYFTGEMIYKWMFDEYACLKPFKEAAYLLAEYTNWPMLYDVATLKENKVPCAAIIYDKDMYTDRELSEQTAATIKGIKVWINDQYEHDALHEEGEAILNRLLAMLQGGN